MKVARVRCCIEGCTRSESITYDDAGVTGMSQVEAFAAAADLAGWLIGTEEVQTPSGTEIRAHNHCPEHRLAPAIAEILGAPV